MRIAILATYFGRLPPFTQLFLASCAWNKGINFLLIGDAWKELQEDVPDNCKVIAIDLEEFKQRAHSATGIEASFSSPYKICDYKPALGHIFAKELNGYDYWGICDIDLVFGDIESFLTTLNQYDVFSTRSEFLSGPLFLMRNCDDINLLYRQSRDYQTVLSSDRHFSFCECAFAWVPLRAGKSILDVKTEIESMTEVIEKAARLGKITAHFISLSLEPERNFKDKVRVESGRVLKDRKEYIHYHHHNNKGRAFYTYPRWHWTSVPVKFSILNYGVFGGLGSLHLIYRCAQGVDRWKKRVKRALGGLASTNKDDNSTKIT